MTLAQLAVLIKNWLIWAVGQTVGQMKDFLDVTVGEVAWVAAALGYPSAPVNFSGIVAQLDLLQSNIDTIETQILALGTAVTALGSPMQAGSYVVMPPSAPSNFGGSGLPLDTASVWNYVDADAAGYTKGALLDDAGWYAINRSGISAEKHAYGDYIRYHFDYTDESLGDLGTSPPIIDPSTILATDATVVDWLNRTDTGGFAWTYLGNLPVSYSHTTTADEWWICDISDLQFRQLQGGAASTPNTAPVWPGLALVTLGTPVALDLAVNVNVPMDGVLIALTAVTPAKPAYVIGDQTATAHIGQIAFVDDNGDMEYPQNLSFANELYVPLHMAHAAGVKIRTIAGVSGSVTPWTVT